MSDLHKPHPALPDPAETLMRTNGLGSLPEAELQACLRNLMGLLALPALWSSRAPDAILRLLAESIEEMIPAEFFFVTAIFDTDEAPLSLLRVGRQEVASDSEEWSGLCKIRVSGLSREPKITLEMTPCGELRVVRLMMNYSGHIAALVIGASRSDFPRPAEMVLLRSAASLAASGLRTARLVQEREEALRTKDDFLAMLGHELRNPLAPILTAVKLLRLRGVIAAEKECALIERQAHHLVRLVDDLLDVSRVTQGKFELRKEHTELATVIAKAVETASPLLEERQHRLEIDVASEGMLIDADPSRLAQVIGNLLNNAAKYTDRMGCIRVHASREGNDIVISVSDSGIGIAPEMQSRIFDIFVQDKQALDRAKGGLGLGLAIVRSIAQLHGGSVNVMSEGIGKGSTFTVRLPAVSRQETIQAASIASPVTTGMAFPQNGYAILLVDDNLDAAEPLAEALGMHGHTVRIAADGPAALALTEEFSPEIALLDIGLPGMDGYELAARLRKQPGLDKLYLIAVTGYGQETDRLLAKNAGFDMHFIKPIGFDELEKQLRALVLPYSPVL